MCQNTKSLYLAKANHRSTTHTHTHTLTMIAYRKQIKHAEGKQTHDHFFYLQRIFIKKTPYHSNKTRSYFLLYEFMANWICFEADVKESHTKTHSLQYIMRISIYSNSFENFTNGHNHSQLVKYSYEILNSLCPSYGQIFGNIIIRAYSRVA